MTRRDDDDQPRQEPLLRVVRGDATPEETAALVAVLLAARPAGAEAPGPARSAQNAWSDRSRLLRRPLFPGPGAWRSSSLPS
jgi:Acyl-CoA carboxylase epsilon subunit